MVIPARRLIGPAALAAAWLLASCAAAPVPGPASAKDAPPLTDWRALAILPFGSSLQELTMPAHELLMFGEQKGEECYALDEPAQRVAGREVESYQICFLHGRLDRVELAVRLPSDSAAAEFSRYCDEWQKGAASPWARSAGHCSGALPHGPFFRAELGDVADDKTVPLWVIVTESPLPESP